MSSRDYVIEKQKTDFKEGVKAQHVFRDLMINLGFQCQEATDYQDKYEHWDLLTFERLDGELNVLRYDVKGLKAGIKKGYAVMEIQTIDSRVGWLYAELMDVLVLEVEDSFLFINRKELATLMDGILLLKDVEYGTNEIYSSYDVKFDDLRHYERYKRDSWGNDDITFKAPFEDFMHLVYQKLNKSDGKLERIIKNW